MRTFAALLAVTALIGAQAATAAELADGGRTSGAFVGAYLKLPLAGERATPSQAHGGLKLSVVHQYRDARSPLVQYEADALDLRLGAEGRPSLYLAGAPAAARLGYDDAAEGEQ